MNNWPLKVVTVWERNLKLRGDIPGKGPEKNHCLPCIILYGTRLGWERGGLDSIFPLSSAVQFG